MKNVTKILGITLVVLIIAFIVTLIITIISNIQRKEEKQTVNSELASDQTAMLIKCAQYRLKKFNTLSGIKLADNNMVLFASDYIEVVDEQDKVQYIDVYRVVEKSELDSAVKKIFDKNINYSNLEYEIKDNKVYIPNYPRGTDAQIYKLKSKEYDKKQGVYTVYIDCLEINSNKFEEVKDSNLTEYSENDVIATMIFKYIEKEGRKVLVAYDLTY